MEKAIVIHIVTKMELGGAQQNTLFTVTHLDERKFQPFLITGQGGELLDEAANEFKNLYVVPDLIREVRPLKDLKAFLQIVKIINKIKRCYSSYTYFIVHTHSAKAGILGRWAAKVAGIPVIIHSFHSFGFNDFQPFWVRQFYIMLERITSWITTWFITVSEANRERALRLGIFSSEQSTLIRSGIDIEQFQKPLQTRREAKESLALPENVPVVTMISCLKPQKAPIDFVKACHRIKREVPEACFLMVGDGVLRGAVEKEVTAGNLNGTFHLLGWRRDIVEILHITDVLVLSSLWEGLPRVLPQAMAAGVPAVATRVDGSPEAVYDKVNGFLVNPGDVNYLAEKVIFLLKNSAQARTMGKKGREMVGEFDVYKMVYDQENLYKKLLTQNLQRKG